MRRGRRDDEERQTRALMALALILALALAASFLLDRLRIKGEIEDCLLAQRSNCDALIDRN